MAEYSPCQILFIAASADAKVKTDALAKLQNKGVLLVGEEAGLVQQGRGRELLRREQQGAIRNQRRNCQTTTIEGQFQAAQPGENRGDALKRPKPRTPMHLPKTLFHQDEAEPPDLRGRRRGSAFVGGGVRDQRRADDPRLQGAATVGTGQGPWFQQHGGTDFRRRRGGPRNPRLASPATDREGRLPVRRQRARFRRLRG